MAIGYEDMCVRDAYNYFQGCWAFRVTNNGQRVTAFTLDMSYDGEYEDALAHDHEFSAHDWDGHGTIVLGDELFSTDEWITHRFQLGYVPLGNNGLARVDAEPVSSRMCKGLQGAHCRSLPVVAGNDTMHSRLIRRVQATLNTDRLPQGIAKVLSLGTPPVMRSRVPLPEAYVRARTNVMDYMRERSQLVFVPDFRMALVKHRTDRTRAYILYNGAHIGHLNLLNEEHLAVQDPVLRAILIRSRTGDRKVSKYIEETRMQMTRNLLTADVVWAT